MNEHQHLARFVERSEAFEPAAKRNILLFLAGAKPNLYAQMKIKANIHDKQEFERLLRLNKFQFIVSKPKGFEEIIAIKANKAVWKFKGTWYGYDIFRSLHDKSEFDRYLKLLKQKKHKNADLLAGELYGYPKCCVDEYIRSHDENYLRKRYTYHEYFSKLHSSDLKFPFIAFTPGSIHCPYAIAMNRAYGIALKRISPRFYKEFTIAKTYNASLIIDFENDFGIWKQKDGHDYVAITKNKIKGHHYLLSFLSKKPYARGTIVTAQVTTQYHVASVKPGKRIGHLSDFHHERRFTLL